MEITVHTATRGVWKPFRFACPACHHVTVAKAFGAARAAGAQALAAWTVASAEADAVEDARRVVETAACPRCGHRDTLAVRRYEGRRTRVVIVCSIGAALLAAGVFVLPSTAYLGLIPIVVLVVAALVGGQPLSRKELPPLAARVVFPTEPDASTRPGPPSAGGCAMFLCVTCHQVAATLALRDGVLELRDFVEDVDDPIGPTERDALVAGLLANDAKRLHAGEPQWVPFYCAACGASYCSEHWKVTVLGTQAGELYRDAAPDGDTVTLRCPSGHEHQLL